MGLARVLLIISIVVLGNAVVWGLFFLQRRRLAARVTETVEKAGEIWVIRPENGFYVGMLRGVISTKTMGAMGLTETRLIFIPPLGHNMEFPVKDITGVSENTWFAGNYRGGNPFIILKLSNGSEVGFQTRDHQRWMQEIEARISAA